MKELDEQKLDALTHLNQPKGSLRSRLVVLWFDGEQDLATRWAEQYKFPIGIISSQSPDLKAWNVEPSTADTTVIVVENHIAGTVTGLADAGDELVQRVKELAGELVENDDYSIQKWAGLVVRKSPPKPVEVLASPAETQVFAAVSPPSTDGLQLLVVGRSSANIVRFDLATGEATVAAKLANGSMPWSLAINQSGEIFVGLRGGKKNIVRLVSGRTGDPNGPLVPVDLTDAIGRFGPGLMAFDGRGLLNVAGDTERAVHRYDVATGKLVESMRLRAANLVGLTLAGNRLYAAEYFQRTILRFDLNTDPAQGAKFVYKSEHLDVPHGMTIGHNGNLYVSSLRNSRVQEFSGETGEFIRTFVDVRTLGAAKVKDLHFEPRLESYFISADDAVYVLSPDGTLLAKYQSEALSDAVAIAVVPTAQPVAAAHADLSSREGLIGYATIRETHLPVALRLRAVMGDPAVTTIGGNKLVLETVVTIDKPFEFKGEYSLVVAGLVSRNEAGKLHFKGSVSHNAGLMEFDSAATLGEGIRANGGGFSGGFAPYFIQLDRR